MTVEELENLMPGIANVFKEEDEVNISAHIDKILNLQFDGDEENF